MKKMLAIGFVCAMVFAPAVSVQAAEVPATCHVGGCNLGECFMDTDCDGICGNHYFVDEDGDGICDFHCYSDVNADGICDFYIDSDEDGICDHCHDHGRPVPADTLDGVVNSAIAPSAPAVTYTAPAPTVTYDTDYYGCYGSGHHRRSGHHRGHC